MKIDLISRNNQKRKLPKRDRSLQKRLYDSKREIFTTKTRTLMKQRTAKRMTDSKTDNGPNSSEDFSGTELVDNLWRSMEKSLGMTTGTGRLPPAICGPWKENRFAKK